MTKSMLDYKRKNHKTPRLVIADAYTIGSNPFESKQAKDKSVYYITARKFLETIDSNLYSKEDTRYINKGLSKLIDYLLFEPITMEEILETDRFLEFQKLTLNGLQKFEYPRELWIEIVEKYNGRIPFTIKSLPEGSVFYPHEPVIEIENSVKDFGVLSAWFESSLLKVWAATEMVTQLEHWVLYYMGLMDEIYSDSITKEQKDFFARNMLHNFGCRAGMTPQESEWLGEEALFSFSGTDTFSGAYQFWKNAGEEAGHSFSVSALAHRNVQSYDLEFDCFEALFSYLKSGEIGSNVADCNDFFIAVKKIGTDNKLIKGCLLELALRSKELGLNIVVVIRPDSGDAAKQLLFVCDTAKEYGLFREIEINGNIWYGGTLLRFIEGDGMTWASMKEINKVLLDNKYLVWEWGLYGMGGGMRNKLSRDHASTKYALCAVGEELRPVVKFSETAGKSTLPGPFKLLRSKEALENGITIVSTSEDGEDARVIYYDGLNPQFFGNTMFEDNRDYKKRIREQMATMPKRLKNDIPASDFILNKRLELLAEYAPEKLEFFKSK
jgi:nicotinamide phosphoribosyltransferase